MKKLGLPLLTFFLAFTSLGYELVIARMLSEMTGRVSQAQSLTVAFFILSLGLGAGFVEWRARKNELRLSDLFPIEVALYFVSLLTPWILAFGHLAWMRYADSGPGLNFILLLQLPTMALGFLSGTELPYLLHSVKDHQDKSVDTKILAINYFGAVAAAILLNYFLFPRSSGYGTLLYLSSVSLICVALIKSMWQQSKRSSNIVLGVSIFVLIGSFFMFPRLEQIYLKSLYYIQSPSLYFSEYGKTIEAVEATVQVERIRTPYQTIDLVEKEVLESEKGEVKMKSIFRFYINGELQVAMGNEDIYHQLMAHVPLSLTHTRPKRVLILGGGDGILAKELLRRESIEKITLVELDPAMIDLAKVETHLTRMNSNALSNSKLNIIIGDAFTFVSKHNEKFDAIYLDFPFPRDEDVSKLYSLEFYSNVRRLMSEKAIGVLDFPIELRPKFRNIIRATLKAAGFESFGYGHRANFIIFSREGKFNGEAMDQYVSERVRAYYKNQNAIYLDADKDEKPVINTLLHPKLIGN